MAPPQRSVEQGFVPASTIERAAQHLDWTIAFGTRHSTPRGLEGTTNQRPETGPPGVARAPRLTFGQTALRRLPLISGLFLATVLLATAGSTGIFFLMRSAGEKATPESSPPRATASEPTLSIGGLAMTAPATSAAQSTTLAVPAPTPAALEWGAKPALEIPPSVAPPVPGPKETVTPAATIIMPPALRKLPSEPAFSAAEIAALLARGDWLFATGDVASARLLYRRAADAGVARAAVRLGETFDPGFSAPPHLHGFDRDSSIAAYWYSRAGDLGATGVASRLKSLEGK
jgi:hypothetical protein